MDCIVIEDDDNNTAPAIVISDGADSPLNRPGIERIKPTKRRCKKHNSFGPARAAFRYKPARGKEKEAPAKTPGPSTQWFAKSPTPSLLDGYPIPCRAPSPAPPLPCFARPPEIHDDDDWALIAYLAWRRRNVVKTQLERVLHTPTGPPVYTRRFELPDVIKRVVEVRAWEAEELVVSIAHRFGAHAYLAWVTPHCIADRWGTDAVCIKPFADSGNTQAAAVHRLLMGMLWGVEGLVFQVLNGIVSNRNMARVAREQTAQQQAPPPHPKTPLPAFAPAPTAV